MDTKNPSPNRKIGKPVLGFYKKSNKSTLDMIDIDEDGANISASKKGVSFDRKTYHKNEDEEDKEDGSYQNEIRQFGNKSYWSR
jgi:hypothetical protein